MGGACFDIAEIITQIFGQADVRQAVGAAHDEWEVLGVIGDHLDPAVRATWDAEAAVMPRGSCASSGRS